MVKAKIGEQTIDTVIGNHEWLVYDAIKRRNFVGIKDLNEQERLVADNLFKQNVLRKVRSKGKLGYATKVQETL